MTGWVHLVAIENKPSTLAQDGTAVNTIKTLAAIAHAPRATPADIRFKDPSMVITPPGHPCIRVVP